MKFFLNFLVVLFFSSVLKAQCPVIEGAMINACSSNEGTNEFVLFTTTASAAAGDYTLYYGDNSIPSLGLPVSILAGINAVAQTGTGSVFSTNGCIINLVTSAATVIPAGSTVIFMPAGFDANYDITPVCTAGTVYVVFIDISALPSVWNAAGTFANNTATAGYLQITNGATGCTSAIRNYNYNWTSDTDGNTVWWDAAGIADYNNNGCSLIAPAVTITNIVASPVCAGSTSTTASYNTNGTPNGYSLTWDAAALAAGFTDISNAPLTASPLTIAVPPAAAPAGYNASIVVKNTASGISSTAQNFTVTVDPQTVPLFNPVAPICNGAVAPVLPATSVNGITGTWSPAVVSNTTSATYIFTPSAGFCATAASLPVTVQSLPTVFLIGSTTSCYGTSANIIFNGTPNATVDYNVNGGPVQTVTLNAAGNKIINSGVLTADLTYSLVSITSAGLPACSQPLSGTATITVMPLNAALISGTTTICSGTATSINFTGTPNATVTYNINSGINQQILLDGTGNATLNTGNLTTNATYKLVSVLNAGLPACLRVISGTAIVTVVALPNASVSGTTTICSGTATNIFFSGTPNAIITYNVDGITPYQTITLDGAGAGSLNTGNLLVSRNYNLVSVSNPGSVACTENVTGSAAVTVMPLPTAAISGTGTICNGTATSIIFSGTPGAVVTYNIDGNSPYQTITLDAAGAATLGTGNLAVTKTYNLVSVTFSGSVVCSQGISGNAVVTVLQLPTAAISGTTAICNGTSATVTFNGTPNAVVTYNVDGITPYQTIFLDGAGNATLNTGNLLSSRTYNLVSVSHAGSVACTQSISGNAVITVYPVTNPPLVNPSIIYCQNETTAPLSATGSNLLWYTGAGATAGFSTAPTPVSAIVGSTDYYVTQTLNTCESVRSVITVTVNPIPATPVVPLIAVFRCGTGPVALKATAPGIVRWYADAALTNFLAAATLYSPTISTSTTFYVTNTENGCVSPSRAVLATVFPMVVQVTGFSYAPSTVCTGSPAPVPVPVSGFVLGGVYSSTPGLSINSITGVINPAASTPGTYTVKYGVGAAICTLAASSTTTITISKSTVPVTTFSYPSPVCINAVNPSPVTAPGFVTGGTYTSAAGLSINAATGVIDLSLSTAGSYTVTYSLNATACTTTGSSTAAITIVAPAAAIPAGGIQRCGSGVVNLSATATGTVKWYADAGLSNLLYTGNAYSPTINATSIFYTTSTIGACVSPQSSVTATVIPVTTQVTTFSYSPSAVCAGSPDPIPATAIGFVQGGVYSSGAGLALNSATGVIDPAASSPGVYTVKYAVNGYQCVLPGYSTANIAINKTAAAVTTFSYPTPVCSNTGTAAPLLNAGFTTGGIFSSSQGLVINGATGVVDLKASTAGSYSITYTVAATPCTTSGTGNAVITINTSPAPPLTKGSQRCGSGALTLDATGAGTLSWYTTADLSRLLVTGAFYNATVNSTTDFYVTAFSNGCVSEPAVITANVIPLPVKPDLGKTNTLCEGDTIVLAPGKYDTYLWQDNSAAPIFTVTAAGTYSVIVKGTNGCTNATSITVAPSSTCSDILFPSAFSPNGDLLNDCFGPLPYRNLAYVTGYSLRIFNRYGQIVFSTNNPYTKWDGTLKEEVNSTGSYMWSASYIYSNVGKKTQRGSVTIVK
jgi:gliding motility-associated-like protein